MSCAGWLDRRVRAGWTDEPPAPAAAHLGQVRRLESRKRAQRGNPDLLVRVLEAPGHVVAVRVERVRQQRRERLERALPDVEARDGEALHEDGRELLEQRALLGERLDGDRAHARVGVLQPAHLQRRRGRQHRRRVELLQQLLRGVAHVVVDVIEAVDDGGRVLKQHVRRHALQRLQRRQPHALLLVLEASGDRRAVLGDDRRVEARERLERRLARRRARRGELRVHLRVDEGGAALGGVHPLQKVFSCAVNAMDNEWPLWWHAFVALRHLLPATHTSPQWAHPTTGRLTHRTG